MKVKKRSGSLEAFDVEKIKKVISSATKDLDANPLELESRVTAVFKEGISTRQIQEQLINQALTLTTITEPDWRYVAGRLLMMNYRKDTRVNRQYDYSEFNKHIENMISLGLYDKKLLEFYTDKDLEEAGKWMQPDRDFDYDYAGANMLVKRYMISNELPQEAYLTISLFLASVEKIENRLYWAKKFYDFISLRLISLATPLLLNLRKPNGNLSSCFINAIDDSLDSIAENWRQVAKISQNGGGVGVYGSKLRGTNAEIRGQAGSGGGLVPWIRILNDIAVGVNQTGKRAGAVTFAVDVWHIDVPQVLELQTENGDQRKKAYDIFPQLVILDEFMRRVEADEQWTLMDPHEVRKNFNIELADLWGEEFTKKYRWLETQKMKLTKKVSAKELFKEIMKVQIETGMPYLAFKCTINKYNPNKNSGLIPCVNLCTESFSNVIADKEVHCCNLVSENLANITEENLPEACAVSVRILDNAIELTEPPVRQALVHNNKYRTIGVGSMGYADWLAKKGITYTNSKSEAESLFEDIAYYTFKASNELAKERGSFSDFPNSELAKGELLCRNKEWFIENSKSHERWLELIESVISYGMRNSICQAIAPNTSSSLLQGCTASTLPVFSKFFYDKNSKGTVPICPPFIKNNFWVYQENKNIPQKVVVDVTSAIQKWTDTGISMELLFNLNDPNFNAKYMYETLMDAWKKECKTVYYIRTLKKSGEVNDKEDCVSCAN